MSENKKQLVLPALDPASLSAQTGSAYPEPFKSMVEGRLRWRLGDAVGLRNFGVNLVELQPGARSSMRHWHSRQDEFVFVLEGELVLLTNEGEQTLCSGDVAGFAAGAENGHCLINRSGAPARYLEIGDRTAGDQSTYPDDDLRATLVGGNFVFTHKDGFPY